MSGSLPTEKTVALMRWLHKHGYSVSQHGWLSDDHPKLSGRTWTSTMALKRRGWIDEAGVYEAPYAPDKNDHHYFGSIIRLNANGERALGKNTP